MTYSEVIQFLFEKLPFYQRVGAVAFKKDLTNTIALCNALGNPQNKFKTIHVAGTNGKGSVSHFLSSIFQEAGYKTGLYTSPHLMDFRERIKINGTWITEDAVIGFVDQIKPLIDSIQPSFFEITVAMAFDYFANEQVDIAIIETGLGGRLDSTNIINPELSIITNIGYDHMDMLGNTLSLIAVEKAGIIKKEKPVVIGEKNRETLPVFKSKANSEVAPMYFAEEEWKLMDSIHEQFLVATFQNKENETITLKSPLAADYQINNLQTVLAAYSVLKAPFLISESALITGVEQVVKNTAFLGRWQVISHQPKVILDCAHNKEGVSAMLKQLQYESFKTLHIVYGCVKDKDFASILAMLPTDAKYYFTQPNVMRAASVEVLELEATKLKLCFVSTLNVKDAYEKVLLEAKAEDVVLFVGSVFLIADVLEIVNNN